MGRYCRTCKKITESSDLKKIKIKRLSFHICLSCGNPYEYKSFGEIASKLLSNNSANIVKTSKAGLSANTYKLYLQTDHWIKTRKRKLLLNPVCEFCREKKASQVHHLRYNDDDGKTILYKEHMKDLMSVCSSCHSKIHDK
jgi:hypothetical protein